MRIGSNVITALLMLTLAASSAFAQRNPYGDVHRDDKGKRYDNHNRLYRRCAEPYANQLFNRDYTGLANITMYHLDNELRSYVKYRCLTSDQIRRLGLLYQTDREKYNFLTYSLNYVFDIDNYAVTGSVLANWNTRDGFYRLLVKEGISTGDYFNPNTYPGYPPVVYIQPQPNAPYGNNPNIPNQVPQYNTQNQPPQYNTQNQVPQYNTQNPPPQYNTQNQVPQYNTQNPPPQYNTQNQVPQYNTQNPPPQYNTQNQVPQYNPQNPPPQYNNTPNQVQGMMTARDFDIMKERVKQNTLETGKLETAKAITRESILTATQVVEIIRLFTFDTNRLDFAKFAFDYTYDREAYNVVSDALAYQKNKEDLQQFVQKKK